MNTRELEYVIALYEARNFSTVARNLFISQSALSRSIASIEAEIGSPLFIRTPAGVTPTPVCERYIPYARDILKLEKSMKREINDLLENQTGVIRIGCSLLSDSNLPPKLVLQFHQEYPGIRLAIEERRTVTRIKRLKEGQIDLMLSGRLQDSQIASVKLCDNPLYLVVPRGYLPELDDMPYAVFEDVVGRIPADRHQYILQPAGFPIRDTLDRMFASYGIVPTVLAETRIAGTMLSLCESGMGMTIITGGVLTNRYGRIAGGSASLPVNLFPLPDAYTVGMYVHYLKGYYLSAAMKRLIELLRQTKLDFGTAR